MASILTADKILERNGTDNTNVNGASWNFLITGHRNGRQKGYLNECAVTATSSNLMMATGALLVEGFRMEISSVKSFDFASLPSQSATYILVASITLSSDGSVTDSVFVTPKASSSLVTDDIFHNGYGTYQETIATFTITPTGIDVNSIVMIADLIMGGVDFNASMLNVGTITSASSPYGTLPVVDITARYDEPNDLYYWDFSFTIPEGKNYTFDTSPIENSTNGITSGGVYPTYDRAIADMLHLGAYDTYTYDSTTGIYTVTRQTTYLDSDYIKDNITTVWLSDYNGLFGIYLNEFATNAGTGFVSSNQNNYDGDLAVSNSAYGISKNIYDLGLLLRGRFEGCTTADQIKSYLSSNDVYVQFKSKTSHTEYYDNKHFARTGQPYIEDWKKSEADRSSNLTSKVSSSGASSVLLSSSLNAGSYTLSLTCASTDAFDIKAGTTTIGSHATGTTSFSLSFVLSSASSLSISGTAGSYSYSKIMLNAGSVALPYQPYEGAVVHESRISNVDNTADLAKPVSTAVQTKFDSLAISGYDLEQKLVSDITLADIRTKTIEYDGGEGFYSVLHRYQASGITLYYITYSGTTAYVNVLSSTAYVQVFTPKITNS